MSGSLYVVLFDNGTAKVGKSSNVGSRVDQHRKSAASMGVGVERVYYTDPIPDMDTDEFSLISIFTEAHDVFSGREFFANCTTKSVEAALEKMNVKFNSCASLYSTTTMGETWVVAKAFKLSDKDPDANISSSRATASERIDTILMANGSTLTEGVIINRMRGFSRGDVLRTLRMMKSEGTLIRDEYKHPANRKPIIKWRLNK